MKAKGLSIVISVFIFVLMQTVLGPTVWGKENKVLNLYGWAGTIPKGVITQFENETGIKVYFDFFSQNEILEAKLLSGTSSYDLVFPSLWPYFGRQMQVGVYQPLDKSKIPNLNLLNPVLMKRIERADPGNLYGVPFTWGAVAIGYNKNKISKRLKNDEKIEDYNAILDEKWISKYSDCRVYIYESPVEIFSTILLYLGYPPNSTNEVHIQEAIRLLKRIRPHIARFDSTRTATDLANGDACISLDLSSEIALAQVTAKAANRGVSIEAILPRTGTFLWVDMMGIPKSAPHPENAHRFINFLLRPDIIAKVTNKIYYANAVPASSSYVQGEIVTNPLVYPSNEIIKAAYIGTAATPEHERRLMRELIKIMTD